MFNIHLILLLNQLSKHMQVCQPFQRGLQCIHSKTGFSFLNSKDLSGGSQQLQAAHPKQQNPYSDDPTCDSKMLPLMHREHTQDSKNISTVNQTSFTARTQRENSKEGRRGCSTP